MCLFDIGGSLTPSSWQRKRKRELATSATVCRPRDCLLLPFRCDLACFSGAVFYFPKVSWPFLGFLSFSSSHGADPTLSGAHFSDCPSACSLAARSIARLVAGFRRTYLANLKVAQQVVFARRLSLPLAEPLQAACLSRTLSTAF